MIGVVFVIEVIFKIWELIVSNVYLFLLNNDNVLF